MAESLPNTLVLTIRPKAEPPSRPIPAISTFSGQPSNSEQASPAMLRPFVFLKFPFEIRAKIYKILEDSVNNTNCEARHLPNQMTGLARGRKSLVLTCRQVNQEFAPYFLRSTRMCLEYSGKRTPEEFVKFLGSLAPYKTLSIRHLEYRVCALDRLGRTIPDLPEGLFYRRRHCLEAERQWMAKIRVQLGTLSGALCLETLEVVRHVHADFLHGTQPSWKAKRFKMGAWNLISQSHPDFGLEWFSLECHLWVGFDMYREAVCQRSMDGWGLRLFWIQPNDYLQRLVAQAKQSAEQSAREKGLDCLHMRAVR